MNLQSSRDTLSQLRQHMAQLYGQPAQLGLLAALMDACHQVYGNQGDVVLHLPGLSFKPASGDDAAAWLRQLLAAADAAPAHAAPVKPQQALALARIEVRNGNLSVALVPGDPLTHDDWNVAGATDQLALRQTWQFAAATLAQALAAQAIVELSRALGLARSGPPLYLVHGADGSAAPFGALAAHLDCRVHAFRLRRAGCDLPSIQALAAHYAQQLLASAPADNYRIGGHSFGAIVAYEMALHLRRAGKQVEQVILLDPSLAMAARERSSDAANELLTLYLALYPEMSEQQVGGQVGAAELEARIAQRMPKARIEEILRNRAACLALLRRYHPTPAGRDLPACLHLHAELPLIADWTAAARAHRQPGMEVPGNHFSMLAEPHVGRLAQLIQPHREPSHDHFLRP